MKHPLIIDAKGFMRNTLKNPQKAWGNLKSTFRALFNSKLQPEKYYMTQAEFDDIVKWGKGDS